MSSYCSATRLIILFSVIISIGCDISSRSTRQKHAHNKIQKEDETTDYSITVSTTPPDTQEISTSEEDIVESANRRRTSLKVTIPLHYQNAQKLSSIKHPLPKHMHDIMPHEPVRHSAVNQYKVHHDFLHHEGPKLQRRLHHHFTIEEIRHRRKELREKLLARHKKLEHVTPRWLVEKEEDTLMMPMHTTEKIMQRENYDRSIDVRSETPSFMSKKKYILDQQKNFLEEDNQLENDDSIPSNEVTHPATIGIDYPATDFLLPDQVKHTEEYKYTITNPITTASSSVNKKTSTWMNTEAYEEVIDDAVSQNKTENETNENNLTRSESIEVEAQKQRLLDYLRRKYRFSSKLNYQTPTFPSIETSTWLERSRNISHQKVMSGLRYILGGRENNFTTTDSIVPRTKYELYEQTTLMTEDGAVQIESIPDVTSPAVYISKIKKLFPTSTHKTVEYSTVTNEEPEMNQDWRAHLRKAISRRLHRLRENSETQMK